MCDAFIRMHRKTGCSGRKDKKEDGVIHLYTLKDNDQLWQSAKLFEEKFPEYQVVIDVGVSEEDGKCTFRINGAPFPRQRCKRLAPAVRYPFVVTC